MNSLALGDRLAVVAAVAAYPVKGASAAPAQAVVLDADGVVGDRRHAVLDAEGVVLTADRAPRLRDVRAGLTPDGEVLLDVPGHGASLAGPEADAALTALLGRPARLVAVTAGSQLDAPVHLVSSGSVAAARRGEHAAADCACSIGEPRANLAVDLATSSAGGDPADGDPAGGGREDSWVGLLLAVGTAVLRVQRRPGHCLGVYAEVVRPGRVAVGDVVRAATGNASG